MHNANLELELEFKFGNTILRRTQDLRGIYKHSYKVYYQKKYMGFINFGLYRSPILDSLVHFTIDNEVFYNDTLKCLKQTLRDLNLEINNYTQIDIAIDSCKFNAEQFTRRELNNRDNEIVCLKRKIGRTEWFKEHKGCNSGPPNNLFAARTVHVKNNPKKNSQKLELRCYNKFLEIKNISPEKEYILDYNRELRKKKIRSLHRTEVVMGGRKIYDYERNLGRKITLDDLVDKLFLFEMFKSHLDKILKIYRGTGRKRSKQQLYATPIFDVCEDI